ncbi:MAG: protein-glutamate O-methyltransferase [Thermodesulfobacteriota bacterium]|nr:protein-glutamate O-methyltransferase [Thermodesulfobacteriota bacterium]
MIASSFDLTDKEFRLFKEMIYQETGIHLSDQKKRLLVARLSRRLRALELKTFTDYYQYLCDNKHTQKELINLINRITTNKTDFFREMHHFAFLTETALPKIIKQGEDNGNRRLRVWSAGCSSGEEPYSIAMTLADAFSRRKGWDIKILATDLDTQVLKKATDAIYNTQTIAPVPSKYLSKYFIRKDNAYTITPQIRSMISFRRLNLMDKTFPMKNPFDIIFCRNVIIYFDPETKERLMGKVHCHLKKDGYMFIGHSESLMNMKGDYKYIKTTIYKGI